MLWRALKHIPNGFYIDVGAWSPNIDSVTRAFYTRGWIGINIEPNPECYGQLQDFRPKDCNLCLAVSDHEGTMEMNFVDSPGLSTLDDGIASQHRQRGRRVKKAQVDVSTLQAVWEQYVEDGQEVHFIKVDVEGFEQAVLRGLDWAQYRPWVVVVEATLPMSQIESHEAWEPILLEGRYQFAYADGLNRYYVALEHSELMPAFTYPPNVFDDFISALHQEAEATAARAEAVAAQAEATAAQRLTQLQDVFTSTSWRMTAPVRSVRSSVRRLAQDGLMPQAALVFRHALLYADRRPRLKGGFLWVISRLPGKWIRLIQAFRARMASPSIYRHDVDPSDPAQLSLPARKIYTDLNAAIERHKSVNC